MLTNKRLRRGGRPSEGGEVERGGVGEGGGGYGGEHRQLGVGTLAATVGEKDLAVALPIGPGPEGAGLIDGRVSPVGPLGDETGVAGDKNVVFVARGAADIAEGELEYIAGSAAGVSLSADIAEGDAGVLQFIGHDEPIGVIDPSVPGLGEVGGEGGGIGDGLVLFPGAAVFGIEIAEDKQVAVIEAVVAGELVPDMAAAAEEAPSEVAGVVPSGAATESGHDLVGDGDGTRVGIGKIESGGGRIGFSGGEGGMRADEQGHDEKGGL